MLSRLLVKRGSKGIPSKRISAGLYIRASSTPKTLANRCNGEVLKRELGSCGRGNDRISPCKYASLPVLLCAFELDQEQTRMLLHICKFEDVEAIHAIAINKTARLAEVVAELLIHQVDKTSCRCHQLEHRSEDKR